MDCKEKVKDLPDSPGVYIMKDGSSGILYVGKALSLRKRVAGYFQPRRKRSERLEAMVSLVRDIAYIPTATEAEALIYENNLIKQLSPKYNVALRDDKSYPMLKLTINERFPRLFITRQKKDDGALYYGPYTSAKLLRQALIFLRQIFPLRSCVRLPKKACLNYHIRQCLAPCAAKVDDRAYADVSSELKMFLEGKRAELLRFLTEKMLESSRRQNFEEAADIKKRLEALGSISERTVSYAAAGEAGELRNILGIKGPLDRIEAFDVSNIMGKAAAGSMILFFKGRPKKSDYRRFRIKTVRGIDDYAMMREIIRRRYSRLLAERGAMPDLILIDGGKGHLAAACEVLKGLGLDLPAVGIAKEFERIYLKGKDEPLVLPRDSKALHLLERIRDEAHRFAIAYHKALSSRTIVSSELDGIMGIGEKRKKALFGHFGTVEKIKAARLDEILKVGGIDERSARNIIDHFKG